MIDTGMEPSWTEACPFSEGRPIVMTLVGSGLSQGVHWGVDARWDDRICVLDLPTVDDGNIVVVGSVCCGVDRDDQLNAVQGVALHARGLPKRSIRASRASEQGGVTFRR